MQTWAKSIFSQLRFWRENTEPLIDGWYLIDRRLMKSWVPIDIERKLSSNWETIDKTLSLLNVLSGPNKYNSTDNFLGLNYLHGETWHMCFIKLNITGSDKMRATGCMNAACKTRLMWNKNKIMPSVRGSQETSSRNLSPILFPHYVAFPITVWNSHYVISPFMSPILCHGWFPPSYRTNKTLQADFRPVSISYRNRLSF